MSYEIKPATIVLLLALLAIAAWIPVILFPTSILLLLGASKLQAYDSKVILVLTLPFVLFSIMITSLADPSIRYAESDFLVYYANYLSFLFEDEISRSSSSQYSGFSFGGGFEVSLPLLHSIFAKIIDSPAPFTLKLFHIILLETLLVIALFGIAKKHRLKVQNFALFLCFVFVFIKWAGLFNHLRQSYSSLIILIAIFNYSDSKLIRRSLFAISILFHLSAILIYPLTKWLIFSRRNFGLNLFWVFTAGMFLLYITPLVIDSIASNYMNSFIFSKVLWSLFRSQEEASLEKYFIDITIRLAYLVPIIVFSILNKTTHYHTFKIAIFIFFTVLVFYFFPSLPLRFFEIFLLILMGYLYFFTFGGGGHKSPIPYLIILPFLFIHMGLWLNNGFYFYEFPMYSTQPFNYLSILTDQTHIIDRTTLPSYEQFIKNLND